MIGRVVGFPDSVSARTFVVVVKFFSMISRPRDSVATISIRRGSTGIFAMSVEMQTSRQKNH